MTGSDLRKQRLFLGLTQKKMAHYFGVSRGTYSSWESKYKHKRLPIYVQKKAKVHLSVAHIFAKSKKESILKRILRWIKN